MFKQSKKRVFKEEILVLCCWGKGHLQSKMPSLHSVNEIPPHTSFITTEWMCFLYSGPRRATSNALQLLVYFGESTWYDLCGGQRSAHGSQWSFPIMWTPGIKLRLLDLATSTVSLRATPVARWAPAQSETPLNLGLSAFESELTWFGSFASLINNLQKFYSCLYVLSC